MVVAKQGVAAAEISHYYSPLQLYSCYHEIQRV